MKMALNMCMTLGIIFTLMMLIIPIQEHVMSFLSILLFFTAIVKGVDLMMSSSLVMLLISLYVDFVACRFTTTLIKNDFQKFYT